MHGRYDNLIQHSSKANSVCFSVLRTSVLRTDTVCPPYRERESIRVNTSASRQSDSYPLNKIQKDLFSFFKWDD